MHDGCAQHVRKKRWRRRRSSRSTREGSTWSGVLVERGTRRRVREKKAKDGKRGNQEKTTWHERHTKERCVMMGMDPTNPRTSDVHERYSGGRANARERTVDLHLGQEYPKRQEHGPTDSWREDKRRNHEIGRAKSGGSWNAQLTLQHNANHVLRTHVPARKIADVPYLPYCAIELRMKSWKCKQGMLDRMLAHQVRDGQRQWWCRVSTEIEGKDVEGMVLYPRKRD